MKNIRNKALKWHPSGQKGFSLVELMIALAMSGIIIAAVYAAYIVQQRSERNQGQVVEMQQNMRAALEVMGQDIRMAMYDPGNDAGANIETATVGTIRVRMDFRNNAGTMDDDGDFADPLEDVRYRISDDADDDGVSDSGSGLLQRTDINGANVGVTIAENIHAIEFFYLPVDDPLNGSITPPDLDDIEVVQVTLLMVAAQRDPKYTNNQTYVTAGGNVWGPFNDNFRRRLLTHSITIRNQGT